MTGFWGIEVKPGQSCTYQSENEQETLYVTQATLGLGSSTDRTVLQCSVDEKAPVFLCSLLPEKTESCALNLVFRDYEFVSFSVVGKTSVHISGYVAVDEGGCDHEDELGEDIAETESDDESSDFEYGDEYDEDDDEFIDDDEEEGFNVFGSSPPRKSGVVIEEIVDEEEPENGDGDGLLKRKKKDNKKKIKKSKPADDEEDDSGKQIVLKNSAGSGASVLESEDEDGFPVSTTDEGKASEESKPETNGEQDKSKESKKKKRKVKATETDSQPEKKKKKKQTQKSKEETAADMDEDDQKEPAGDDANPVDTNDVDERKIEAELGSAPSKSPPAKKQKKKKNKKANADGKTNVETVPVEAKKSSLDSDEKKSASKYSKERTFPNGLVIEDIAMGKPNGKKASPKDQVSVHYIGKLKKNGKIFDLNIGRAPFKFRLGVGQVIKGWDVGVDGMRVGDKRRITIPPAMGYGHQGAGSKIPPNSWLVFDVELVSCRSPQ